MKVAYAEEIIVEQLIDDGETTGVELQKLLAKGDASVAVSTA